MWNIGVDIVEINRFRKMNYTRHKKFYDRNFTPREVKYCLSFEEPAEHFAVTFAGKEAVYKAINQYFNVNLREIEILRDEKGIPHVNLKKSDNSKIGNLQVKIKVSLSHSSSDAIAFALVNFQKDEDGPQSWS